jgi:cytoskeletal protein RodZ
MRLTKIRIVVPTLLLAVAIVAVFGLSIRHGKDQATATEASYGSGSSLQVNAATSNQTISLYSPSTQNSTHTTSNTPTTTTAVTSSTSTQSNTSLDNASIYAQEMAAINGLSTNTTSVPTFNNSNSAPTINVPPSPSCGNNSDSSYYADCMDSYCDNYPETSDCLDR